MSFNITVGSGVPDDQLPPGSYPGKLTAVTEKTITVDGVDKEVFEWAFAIATVADDGSAGEPIAITGLSSRMTGPKSKTAVYLVALLGPAAVQPGATFGMADLVGKECIVQTDLNNSGYHRVVGASAIPTKAAVRPTNRAAAAVVPTAEGEDDDLPF